MTELDKIRPDLAATIHDHITALRAEAAWNRVAAARAERDAAAARQEHPGTVGRPTGPVPDPFMIPTQEP